VPYLRFSRDKRGYENTYVLHAGGTRGKSRPRMLYWFRTPPNIKVGRLALDAEAIRAVEGNNPDVTFDWNKMLKVRATPKVSPGSAPTRGGRKRTRRSPETVPSKGGRPSAAPGADSDRSVAVMDVLEALTPVPPADDPKVDPQLLEAEAHLEDGVAPGDDRDHRPLGSESEDDGQHPVVTLMGHETLVRLRARYAEIQARIIEKLTDPTDLEAMRTRAEALNPDRWTTIETAVTGIERFEADIEAFKAQLGRRPPRSRRNQP